jgi:hypothetical protein
VILQQVRISVQFLLAAVLAFFVLGANAQQIQRTYRIGVINEAWAAVSHVAVESTTVG